MKISQIRREYSGQTLTLDTSASDPIKQFTTWLEEATATEATDPTAMTLATVNEAGHPDLRIVLLKGVNDKGFNFFTNYTSAKGQELAHSPHAAINFYWPGLTRQVKVCGMVEKLSGEESDAYFSSRPKGSQIAAIASPQSQPIDQNQLIHKFKALEEEYQDAKTLPRPEFWGGYRLIPDEIEFWQGQENRLHQRICYQLIKGQWKKSSIAP